MKRGCPVRNKDGDDYVILNLFRESQARVSE